MPEQRAVGAYHEYFDRIRSVSPRGRRGHRDFWREHSISHRDHYRDAKWPFARRQPRGVAATRLGDIAEPHLGQIRSCCLLASFNRRFIHEVSMQCCRLPVSPVTHTIREH